MLSLSMKFRERITLQPPCETVRWECLACCIPFPELQPATPEQSPGQMPIHADLRRRPQSICNSSRTPVSLTASKAAGYTARKDSKKGERERPCNRWCIGSVCRGAAAFVSAPRTGAALLAPQPDTSQASGRLCRIVKMHGTSELASAATATSPRWKRCITGFAFLSRLTAASKHFSTYLLPILLEVSTHFLAGACFLEGTGVTCHFLSHVT